MSDFTSEELAAVSTMPWQAAMLVVMADPNVIGMVREFQAMNDAIRDTSAAGAARSLVEQLVAETVDPERSHHEDNESSAQLLAGLETGTAVIDRICTDAEGAGFKQWLLAVARATAEASREHGFLGGERVSEREQEAMTEIRTALGLGDHDGRQ